MCDHLLPSGPYQAFACTVLNMLLSPCFTPTVLIALFNCALAICSSCSLALNRGGAMSFWISVQKALTLQAGSLVCCVKDGNYRESDSNLTSLLMLGMAAAAASDKPPRG